jgi:hypothetical protein
MCKHKSITNISNLSTHNRLGKLFAQAKVNNQINAQLEQQLPTNLKTLELCLIKDGIATLITSNPAVAFRAQQQLDAILTLLRSMPLVKKINTIKIKVSIGK